MCFTFIGRLQTRLATLIAPLVLTALTALITGERFYWQLFQLMAIVGFTLDLVVYNWLIGYQSRWLTLALGVAEYGVLHLVMGWIDPFATGTYERAGLLFYLLAWLLGWLTIQVALPLLWPRWAEDGGEFRTGPKHASSEIITGSFSQHRSEYRWAFVALLLAVLPWLVVGLQTPAGHIFTGIVLFDTAHLQAIKLFTGFAGAGQLGTAHWDRLPLYYALWGIAGWMWILALQRWLQAATPLRLAAFGTLALVLPAVWLALLALVAWMLLLMPWRSLLTLRARSITTVPVVCIVVLIWGLVLVRAPAPATYLDSGYWKAAAWLRQETSPDIVVATSGDMIELISAISGRETVSTPESADMALTAGMRCDRLQVRFRYQDACVMVLR